MPRPSIRAALPVLACVVAAIPAAGCGSSSGGAGGGGASAPNAQPAPPSAALATAEHPHRGDFPATRGRTLRQLAGTLAAGPNVAPATSVYTPGENRFAFGLLDAQRHFVYAPVAVYVARTPDAPARGPFLAPADSLQVRPAFRSRTSAADAGDVQAVYHAQVPLPHAGRWYVLAVVRLDGGLAGGVGLATVQTRSGIVGVGAPAPRIDTPTRASVGGDLAKIDTRDPPDQMHAVSLRAVLGRRPVALLFATPALCQSRVCGPVTDIAAQLQTVYPGVTFIHNEVYVDNDPSKGLRPQLRAFGLHTEPWLFAIDRHGRIAARLEGAFGFAEFRAALAAAQRGAPSS